MIISIGHCQTKRAENGTLLSDPVQDDEGNEEMALIGRFMHELHIISNRKVLLGFYPVTGERFKQVSERVRHEFPYATMKCTDAIGDAVARVGNSWLFPKEKIARLPEEFDTIHGSPCFDGWHWLCLKQKEVPDGHVLIFPVSRFMHDTLKITASKQNEVWELDPFRETFSRIFPFPT